MSKEISSLPLKIGRLDVNTMESYKSLYDLVVVDSQGVEMDFVISWNPVMRWLSILNCQMASISTRLSFTIILIGL